MEQTELLLRLSWILNTPNIKLYIDEVADIRAKLEETLSANEWVYVNNNIKGTVQKQAGEALSLYKDWGAAVMATGSGKTKVGVDKAKYLYHNTGYAPKILIVVPTIKLRDNGWREEFYKWGNGIIYDDCVHTTCYASLHKYKNETFDLVLLDEMHNLTSANEDFFLLNDIKRCIGLTATPPPQYKKDLFNRLKLYGIYTLSLDEAVKLGLVAPYEFTIVTVPLDNTNKYVKAGSKDKPFFQTEKQQYDYLSKGIFSESGAEFFRRKRMQFIYGLKSKMDAAKMLLQHIIPEDKRTLIFCGNKQQANDLCEYRYYSKPAKPKLLKAGAKPELVQKYMDSLNKYNKEMTQYQGDDSYNKFINLEINRLSCVQALNEGHNVPSLDIVFIEQGDAQELNLVQRVGRGIRWRPGHIGRVILLVAEDTVDVEWANKALMKFDTANIKWVKLDDLRTQKETITF